MRGGRVLLVAAGALTLLIGLGVTSAGAGLLWANATQRDATGYFNSPSEVLQSGGAALTSSVNFTMRPGPGDWFTLTPLGTVRVRARVAGGTFIGIATTAAVDTYLAGVPYDRVATVSVLPFRPEYEYVAGSGTPGRPAAQHFWAESATGGGVQQITWKPTAGRWSLVVMRADAGRGVVADVAVGTNTGVVMPLGVGLAGGGVLLLVAGGLMLGFGIIGLERRRRREAAPFGVGDTTLAGSPAAPIGAAGGRAYPVRLDGRLDPPLSRWRWIIKLILIVPHLLVLMFLWMAVMPLTVLAAFAILFTGRYPRSIFNFTVGVMRWTWRVSFYSFSALATDRYPPFTLEPDSAYPASFDVDYPPRLSRGLVLVKWWLLAIPQYVIVAIFVGGGIGLTGGLSRRLWFVSGGGVVGLLVFIAALILLFTDRYPEQFFDVVMGMNRWSYRVFAYVLLLRDEYPPFRFDAGGVDPGSVAASAPTPPSIEPGTAPRSQERVGSQ